MRREGGRPGSRVMVCKCGCCFGNQLVVKGNPKKQADKDDMPMTALDITCGNFKQSSWTNVPTNKTLRRCSSGCGHERCGMCRFGPVKKAHRKTKGLKAAWHSSIRESIAIGLDEY
eukprot:GFYU01000499.1.p1 GENE.GFYU01000499.1~~GFYU01000499.1.p1  ORF type:complete len:116 (+),score=14.26 GFYU01000499.1:149-496(+)